MAETTTHPGICKLTPQLEDRLFADAERMMSAPAQDRGISLVVGSDIERVLSFQRHLQSVGVAAMSCYHFPAASDWLDDFLIADVSDAVDMVVVDAVDSDVISDFSRNLAAPHPRLPAVVVVGFPSGIMDILSGAAGSGHISFVPDSAVALNLAALRVVEDRIAGSEARVQSSCI